MPQPIHLKTQSSTNSYPTPPPNTHNLIFETCEYIALHGKVDFADVFKSLKMGKLSQIIQVNPI